MDRIQGKAVIQIKMINEDEQFGSQHISRLNLVKGSVSGATDYKSQGPGKKLRGGNRATEEAKDYIEISPFRGATRKKTE